MRSTSVKSGLLLAATCLMLQLLPTESIPIDNELAGSVIAGETGLGAIGVVAAMEAAKKKKEAELLGNRVIQPPRSDGTASKPPLVVEENGKSTTGRIPALSRPNDTPHQVQSGGQARGQPVSPKTAQNPIIEFPDTSVSGSDTESFKSFGSSSSSSSDEFFSPRTLPSSPRVNNSPSARLPPIQNKSIVPRAAPQNQVSGVQPTEKTPLQPLRDPSVPPTDFKLTPPASTGTDQVKPSTPKIQPQGLTKTNSGNLKQEIPNRSKEFHENLRNQLASDLDKSKHLLSNDPRVKELYQQTVLAKGNEKQPLSNYERWIQRGKMTSDIGMYVPNSIAQEARKAKPIQIKEVALHAPPEAATVPKLASIIDLVKKLP